MTYGRVAGLRPGVRAHRALPTSEEIEQEVAEFNQLRQDGTDPDTGQPFDNVERLLDLFLHPQRDRRRRDAGSATTASDRMGRTPNRYGEDIIVGPDVPPSRGAAAGVTVAPRSSSRPRTARSGSPPCPCATTTPAGHWWWSTSSTTSTPSSTARMRTYAIVALLSLGVIVVPARQSGRLLARCAPCARPRATSPPPTCRAGSPSAATTTSPTHPHVQRDARPARGRRSQTSASSSTTPATSCRTPLTVVRGHLELIDAATPRTSRATRELLARRGGPDVAAGRRPDAARQGPATRLRQPEPVDLDALTHDAARQGPGPRRPRLAAGRGRRRASCSSTSSGSPRRCSSSPTTP